MKRTRVLLVGVCLVLSAATATWAQGPGGPGGGGFGGPGGGRFGRGGGRMGLLGLLRIEKVQEELDLVDDQKAEIEKLSESMRGEGGRGEGRRGGGPGGPDGGGRPDFQNMTDEERATFMAERRKEAEARAAKEKEELAKILLDSQMQRLSEISLQVRGVDALSDSEVAAKLEITDEQKQKLTEVQDEVREGMREQMQALRDEGNDDPEAMRTKMTELRKQNEEKVLAVLTDAQREKFASMKGAALELPPEAMFGGRGGGFGGGRGGRGGDRPQRPE